MNTMNHKTYKRYLSDLSYLLIDYGLDSKKTVETKTGEDRVFELGRLMAYYEVISLMQQQCEAFEIEFADINLDRINPDRDLLFYKKKS